VQQYTQSSLRHACKYGSIVVVRKILAESRDHIDTPLNYRSQTALMVAARYGYDLTPTANSLCLLMGCVMSSFNRWYVVASHTQASSRWCAT
jgi:ankyrin repeat protein